MIILPKLLLLILAVLRVMFVLSHMILKVAKNYVSLEILLIIKIGIMFIFSSLLAIIRVISGVHFISDVIAGALVGIVAGIIGFSI